MDMDEADVGAEKDENSRDQMGSGMAQPISNKEDSDDNVTEQTHHIIVPSYRLVAQISNKGKYTPNFGE